MSEINYFEFIYHTIIQWSLSITKLPFLKRILKYIDLRSLQLKQLFFDKFKITNYASKYIDNERSDQNIRR